MRFAADTPRAVAQGPGGDPADLGGLLHALEGGLPGGLILALAVAFGAAPSGADPLRIASIIKDEEESFLRTLDRGLDLFEQAAARAKAAGSTQIPADDAFMLHDTYGFPLELTQEIATEREVEVVVVEKLSAPTWNEVDRTAGTKIAPHSIC